MRTLLTAFSLFFLQAWRWLTWRDYRLLRTATFFSASYYRTRYPDLSSQIRFPLWHWLSKGIVEGRQPGPALIDYEFYLLQTADQHQAARDPIWHYLLFGRELAIAPTPLFQPRYHPGESADYCDYLRGKAASQAPSVYFDHQFYCKRNPDASHLAADRVAAFRHYLMVGIIEKRQPGPFFDIQTYLDSNPALAAKSIDPIRHYFSYGIDEGKSPCLLFDPAWYRLCCPLPAKEDPLQHYLTTGEELGLRPNPEFDPVYYRQLHLADSPTASPLAHYLSEGLSAGLYPCREVAELQEKPQFSVVVPVYNVSSSLLNTCIRSVLRQSYPHWQLCLADDCSPSPAVMANLEHWAAADERIIISRHHKNQGISKTTNSAAALATGEFLVFLDNDDELAPQALFRLAQTIAQEGADLLYSDEDLTGEDGRRFDTFLKPDFNDELLLCHNYITHLVCCRRDLYLAVGGCDSRFDGAQDHDLLLKLSEKAARITHIREILYHWRALNTSTSVNHSSKGYAQNAGLAAVQAALDRRAIQAAAEETELRFFYRVRRYLPTSPRVSILVASSMPADQLGYWFRQLIDNTTYPEVEYLVALTMTSNEKVEPAPMEGLPLPVRAVIVPGFSQSAALNVLAESAQGEMLAFLTDDLQISSRGWLEALLEYAVLPDLGLVRGRIDWSETTSMVPQADMSNHRAAYRAAFLRDCSILQSGLHCSQQVAFGSPRLGLLGRQLFLEAEGLDQESFPELFGFHDLSLRLQAMGKSTYYQAHCRASSSLPWLPAAAKDSTGNSRELSMFINKWQTTLNLGDRYYHPGCELPLRQALVSWLVNREELSPQNSLLNLSPQG